MRKRRPPPVLVTALAMTGPRWSSLALAWIWLVGVVGGTASLPPPPKGGPVAPTKSASSSNPRTALLSAGRRAVELPNAPRRLPEAPKRLRQALLDTSAGRLRSHQRNAHLAVGKLSPARAPAAPEWFLAETRPPPDAALARSEGLSLLARGAHAVSAEAPKKEDLDHAAAFGDSRQNHSAVAAGLRSENQTGTSAAANHSRISSSAATGATANRGGGGITVIIRNESTVATDGGAGEEWGMERDTDASGQAPHRDDQWDAGNSSGSHRQDDTVGNELRRREKEQFLGLPKLFWALVADVVAMGAFVLCIPWILHIARRRRAAPAQT